MFVYELSGCGFQSRCCHLHIRFHYLLTEIQRYTLILSKLNISQEVLDKIKDKSITHDIFRIQDNDSSMWGFYCITFIEYMLAEKTLLAYTY